MAIKKTIGKVTGGADLLHPKLSLGYIVAAIVAVAVLLGVFTGGKWLLGKTKSVAEGVLPASAKGGDSDLEGMLGL